MDREIKFRVWDVENKEMLEVQKLDFEPTFYGGRIAIRPDQYSDYFDPEDMILMQYTGLHDKNGKEIYEGDIIRIKNSLIEIEGEVIFDTIDLSFKVYDKENDCKEMLWYTNKEFEVLRKYIR
jgi:uncharacterized phage protein (TIGR01671 family)